MSRFLLLACLFMVVVAAMKKPDDQAIDEALRAEAQQESHDELALESAITAVAVKKMGKYKALISKEATRKVALRPMSQLRRAARVETRSVATKKVATAKAASPVKMRKFKKTFKSLLAVRSKAKAGAKAKDSNWSPGWGNGFGNGGSDGSRYMYPYTGYDDKKAGLDDKAFETLTGQVGDLADKIGSTEANTRTTRGKWSIHPEAGATVHNPYYGAPQSEGWWNVWQAGGGGSSVGPNGWQVPGSAFGPLNYGIQYGDGGKLVQVYGTSRDGDGKLIQGFRFTSTPTSRKAVR